MNIFIRLSSVAENRYQSNYFKQKKIAYRECMLTKSLKGWEEWTLGWVIKNAAQYNVAKEA